MYKIINLKKDIIKGITFQIIAMIIMYATIPLLIEYLGSEKYGLWVTLFSVLNWLYMCDLGISNDLKNKILENIINKKREELKKNLANGYLLLTFIAIIFLVTVFLIEIYIYNFSTQQILKENISLIFILALITAFNFIISLYKILYLTIHDTVKEKIAQLISNLLFFLYLILVMRFKFYSFEILCISYASINLLTGVFFKILFFKKNKNFIFQFSDIEIRSKKLISKKSIEFFLIQLSMLIILTTDNLIIAKYLGFKEVTEYNTIYKLYQLFIIGINLVLTPCWGLFSGAYLNKDKKWIQKMFKNLKVLLIILLIGLIIFSNLVPVIIKVWTGKFITTNTFLIFLMSSYVFFTGLSGIYMCFLNSIGIIKIQMLLYLFGAVINIPLSIYFSKKIGVEGIMLATNLSIIPLTFILPFQVKKIIKKI